MSSLARLSLANRALVALATVGVIIFGLFAARGLNQELIPSQTLPAVVVTTPYQGAAPSIVEREVTEPIEQQIEAGEPYEEMTSESRQGLSVVQIAYDFGTDTEEVVSDLQQRINGVQGQLPEDVEPTVQAGNFDDFPVVLLAASAPGPQRELADDLEKLAGSEFESIKGVRQAAVTGVREREVRVRLDPDELRERGLTVSQVTQTLQANQTVSPGGQVTGNGETLSIEVGSSYNSVEDIKDIYLRSGGAAPAAGAAGAGGTTAGQTPSLGTTSVPGAPSEPELVRLAEVATVKLAPKETTSITRTNGEPSLGVSITKTSDGNTVDISHAVRDKLANLEDELGQGAELTVVFDQAPFIEDSIEGMATEGLLGLAFAVLIILIFLLSVRSTLVTAVSIPLSVLVALIALWAWDFSLNLLTLGGLTIAVGRVVDDSIVVLENIKRHLGYGEEKRHAVLTGVREVAGAVTASTLTTVAVFLPIAVVGGMVGQLFRPFSLAVTIALLASLLVSLTIIPVLAYWFLGGPAGSGRTAEKVREEALARELRNPLQRTYVPVIKWASSHQVLTILAAILIFGGSMALVPRLETSFLGHSGANTLSITQELPAGTSLAATRDAAGEVETVLENTKQVKTYQVTVGTNQSGLSFGGSAGSNTATFNATIDPEADKEAVEGDLRDRMDDLSGAGQITLSTTQAAAGGSGLEVIVTATGEEKLREAARQVTDAVREVPNTTEVTSNLTTDVPRVDVDVDAERAAEEGLSQSQIAQTVRLVTQGAPAAEANIGDDNQDVTVRLEGPDAADPDKLADLEIPTATGSVQLGDVADVSRLQAPAQISHTGGERSATVTASATADNIGAISADLRDRLADLDLPEGAEYSLGGVSSDQREAFIDLGIALAVAVLIVYLIMVAAFRSIVQPLILLVSVPFAATGTVLLLLATGTPLGVSAMIGMLMLVGIVVTNAIVLLDLINTYRDQGMDVRTAVVEGGRRRLRPVLMTAIATICALTPMALGLTGDGAFISRPLAITVIGGLTTSTLLTLVLVPSLYSLVEGVKEGFQRRREGRHARGAESEDEETLVSMYRDLPDDQSRTEFVQMMGGLARELEHTRGRQLPPGNSDHPGNHDNHQSQQ